MRTIRIKLYKFSELSKDAQEKAIESIRYINDCGFVWNDTKEDAKEIGLKIISLADHKANEGEFLLAANEVAQNILNNLGESCGTYKTAKSFMEEWQPVFNNYMDTEEGEDKLMDMEEEFLYALLEDYRIYLNNDYEYQNSDEAIKETIEANEYEFTKDGKIN